jgi:hypothetical protein
MAFCYNHWPLDGPGGAQHTDIWMEATQYVSCFLDWVPKGFKYGPRGRGWEGMRYSGLGTSPLNLGKTFLVPDSRLVLFLDFAFQLCITVKNNGYKVIYSFH